MADIYQEIWNADQKHAGLKAIRPTTKITRDLEEHGYVVVNENGTADKHHRVIEKVVIPTKKENTYELARVLFNNYTLDQTKEENDTPEEEAEVQKFLEVIHKCPPMQVAREFVAEQTDKEINEDQWWAIIERLWFERFTQGDNKDLSGFEHVVIGEQKQGKLGGYHAWYKYYLDELFRRDDDEDTATDMIKFLSWKGPEEENSPDAVTLSFELRAFDYEAKEFRKLTKPIGGFWVGPSIEGLLALGTVRCLPEAMASKKTVINGVKYNLEMFRSPNDRHVRTFFPKFIK